MDHKLQTFLTLCQTMNYRETAERLHLTQPAVTKQIQALENQYQTKLFTYDGRKLSKTDKCLILEDYAISLQYNYEEMQAAMTDMKRTQINIGATKTIGDYVIAPYIIDYLHHPHHTLSLTVDNTSHLLQMLKQGSLDFAIIEGIFDKTAYAWELFKNEPFIGICPKDHPFAGQIVPIESLKTETLIARETGSGTRNILEQSLKDQGYPLSFFKEVIYISSFPIIKQLVLNKIGISFVYASVIKENEDFATFKVENLTDSHPFHIVYLKNTPAKNYVSAFLSSVNKC